jgi:ATPase subunit of ABC transporter with duplicated ATPase domains
VLTVAGVTRHHGALTVLHDVSLAVRPRARIGVVGPNRIGKSTLLRILGGREPPDGGTVARAPASLRVGLLPQEPDAVPGEPLAAYLARRTGVAEAEARMDGLAERMGEDPSQVQPYRDALERFLTLGGDDQAARAASRSPARSHTAASAAHAAGRRVGNASNAAAA